MSNSWWLMNFCFVWNPPFLYLGVPHSVLGLSLKPRWSTSWWSIWLGDTTYPEDSQKSDKTSTNRWQNFSNCHSLPYLDAQNGEVLEASITDHSRGETQRPLRRGLWRPGGWLLCVSAHLWFFDWFAWPWWNDHQLAALRYPKEWDDFILFLLFWVRMHMKHHETALMIYHDIPMFLGCEFGCRHSSDFLI